MTLEEYDAFCASLAGTTHVVQWGGASVWKIGGKVFAIAGWSADEELGVTFKVSDIGYEILKDEAGLRPAPYLASRGMKWIQRTKSGFMDDDGLREHLVGSYHIVTAGLPKKRLLELGLEELIPRKNSNR
ncbi:MAG: MmcQ/YjbR family DNA-binding protein [Pseudomonadota bacterium]